MDHQSKDNIESPRKRRHWITKEETIFESKTTLNHQSKNDLGSQKQRRHLIAFFLFSVTYAWTWLAGPVPAPPAGGDTPTKYRQLSGDCIAVAPAQRAVAAVAADNRRYSLRRCGGGGRRTAPARAPSAGRSQRGNWPEHDLLPVHNGRQHQHR